MSQSALHVAAYIDAGTGSYLLAAVASGAAGIWFYLRSKASKITGRSRKQAADESEPLEHEAVDSTGDAPSSSQQ